MVRYPAAFVLSTGGIESAAGVVVLEGRVAAGIESADGSSKTRQSWVAGAAVALQGGRAAGKRAAGTSDAWSSSIAGAMVALEGGRAMITGATMTPSCEVCGVGGMTLTLGGTTSVASNSVYPSLTSPKSNPTCWHKPWTSFESLST
jgi:hypothetical protein